MKINIMAVNELIRNNFRNNRTWFAEVIGVDRSYLSQVLNGKVNPSGFKICNGIISYCKENKLDYSVYISI